MFVPLKKNRLQVTTYTERKNHDTKVVFFQNANFYLRLHACHVILVRRSMHVMLHL